ncbi:hypothetical protein Hanom_Chr05g00472631 [Helianthus anomalus]
MFICFVFQLYMLLQNCVLEADNQSLFHPNTFLDYLCFTNAIIK